LPPDGDGEIDDPEPTAVGGRAAVVKGESSVVKIFEVRMGMAEINVPDIAIL